MRIKKYIPEKILRVEEFNRFRWGKSGIFIKFNSGEFNLDDLMLKDKESCLNWLNDMLDNDIPLQMKNDIKEVIEYLYKKYY